MFFLFLITCWRMVYCLTCNYILTIFPFVCSNTSLCHVMQIELALKAGDLELFMNDKHPQFPLVKVNCQWYLQVATYVQFLDDWLSYAFQKEINKSRNRELVELFESGFGIHHAGMLRSDRALTERLFSDGLLKVSTIRLSVDSSWSRQWKKCSKLSASGSCMYCNFGMGSKFASSYSNYQGKLEQETFVFILS